MAEAFLPGCVQSPGLAAGAGLGPAFELKFQVSTQEAQTVESWARRHLQPDPHGDHGAYRLTSVYCDTPQLDVFHRSPGYRRRKYRLRRYGESPLVFLERKSRRGDRVKKKRAGIPEDELPLLLGAPPPEWPGRWFLNRVGERGLQPTCRVAYWRTAFFGHAGSLPVRLTLDRELIGAAVADWSAAPLHEGSSLLPGGVLVELKFHAHLPELFRELLPQLPLQQARVSKYRRCVQLCRLVNGTEEDA